MLSPILTHLIAFFCSVAAAIILMKGLLALHHNTASGTGTRAYGTASVPTLGGWLFLPAMAVGVVAVFIIGLLCGSVSDTLRTSSFVMAVALFFIYILGIIDDIIDIKRWQRNVVLVISCAAFPLLGLYINNLHGLLGCHAIAPVPGFVLTMLFSLLIVKGLEELDDIDGLAATIGLVALAVFAGVFIAMERHIYATMACALAGAVMVFLRYNLWGDERLGNKVRLGHAGTLIIGFSLVYFALKYAMDNSPVIDRHADAILLPYSLFALPMFEYLRVLAIGSWQGLTKSERAGKHIQQIIFHKGFSQWQTIGIILIGEVIIIAMNLSLHHLCSVNITWIIAMNIVVYALLLYVATRAIAAPQSKNAPTADSVADYVGIDGLVSIIMPTYNSAAYVRESIDSIRAQTYKQWELVITDDDSSDDTLAIISEYAANDARIIVQRNTTNGGAAVARNKSLAAAQGQYIAFCDSDDRWLPKKLEQQIAFMQAKDVALCFAPYYTCDENSQYLGYVSAPPRVSLFSMMCDNKIGFLTCIYDTHILGKHLMPNQRKRQDHGMLLNLLKTCSYAYSLPQPLAFYRLRTDNLSARKISLLKYNAQTYTAVFGWARPVSYAFLFAIFLPTYFAKRIKNILINAVRSA